MNIGLVIYGELSQPSGGYLYDRKLVEHLRARGDHVDVISLPPRTYMRGMLDNLTPLPVNGIDVLLEDELAHASLLTANRRLRGRVPILSIVHHLRIDESLPTVGRVFSRRLERAYLRSIDGAIFNSASTRASVARLLGHELTGVVAQPGADHLQPAIEDEQIRRRALEAGPLRIVFVGNLIPRKGLPTLLRALEGVDAELTVIGSELLDPAHARWVRARSNGRVHFMGHRSHDEIERELASAQVIAMPSSYEGFGIAYLEGMGYGLPAIATSAGGAGSFVFNGENGYLIEPGDAGALSDRLNRLAGDRELLAAMGARARATYLAQPTWADAGRTVRDFITDFVNRGGSP